MATHIENRAPAFPLGLEFLMSIRVNTRRQNLKGPQLRGIQSARSGQGGDRHQSCRWPETRIGHVAVVSLGAAGTAGSPTDMLGNGTESSVPSEE